MGGQPFGRIGVLPWAERRTGALPAILVILVIASLVATCAGPTPSPTASVPASSPGVASQAPTPGVTPLPTDPGDVGTWTKLDLPALAAVARLEATKVGAAGVAPTTAFRLTSLDGTAVSELVARLSVTPSVRLSVARVSGSTAELRPAGALRQGQVYRFTLHRTDGTDAAAWAVQAAWPLRIASSVPRDQATGVPTDTGIEITFDQPGVRISDVRERFSISPRVSGRFERHDQTFVFVPYERLARDTLYTVTLRHGLPLPGTGMTLEEDAVIRFETAGRDVPAVHLSMSRPLFDAALDERPVIGVSLDAEDEQAVDKVTRLAVTVHRLPDLNAAIDAYTQAREAPEWAERSSTTPIRTGPLPLVLKATLPLRQVDGDTYARWLRLPTRLPAGWYVVTGTHDGLARQTVLQVTDLAAYSAITSTRSLVWVNSLRSNRPVAGAQVTLAGRAIGRTDRDGLVVATTPAALARISDRSGPTFVIVRAGSRAAFLPADERGICYSCATDPTDAWWHLLTPDRSLYRTTDTINVWGVLRDRDTGKVPASVVLRLTPDDSSASAPQPIATTTATPDRSGAWVAQLSYADIPPGSYIVAARVGSTTVAEAWVSVGPIAKPAWQLSLSTPRHAMLSGATPPLHAVATFFEGTPVAGATLLMNGTQDSGDGEEDGGASALPVTTDANGEATASPMVRLSGENDEQWSQVYLSASAGEPEEGDISARLPVAVFRSTALLDSEATIKGKALTITGAVHDVAFGRFDEPGATVWDVDPRGAPRAGARVTVRVTEVTPIVRKTGVRYDFIAKRTVPVYDVKEHRAEVAARTVTTGADGVFRLRLTVKGGNRSYEVQSAYVDEASREIGSEATAWEGNDPLNREPGLRAVGTEEDTAGYSVGDVVRVQFTGGITKPEVHRYLFAVLSRGLRGVSVQDGARFSTRFVAGVVPALTIAGVRFTGTGYELAGTFGAFLRESDRRIEVRLTADSARYAPGDRATLAVRTLDAAGRPVAASVFVRAVDEKLFAMDAAALGDPLSELYAAPGDGLIAVARTHASPISEEDGKGDTTGGGGERSDFRDWLVARLVTTGADGRASVSFDLSDDLTSWRVVASAVSPRLEAGQATMLLPVGLPFFADAIVASEYLSVDRPVFRVRAYGTALAADDRVTFKVSSDTLPLRTVTVQGKAFQPVEVTLPKLSVGTHRLRIEASTGSGASLRSDALVRTFRVIDERTIRSHTEAVPLAAGTTVGGAGGLTSVTLVDSGRGRVVPLLRELATSDPFRADRALAAAIAREVLADEFGIDEGTLPELDLGAFMNGDGFALLPYASPDLALTAMAALSRWPMDRQQLRWYFDDIRDSADGSLPVGRELWLLVGRASIGDASIGEVTSAAAMTGLTPAQRVTVALAALAVGDEVLARQLERDLLGQYGERLGPRVRLNVGSAEDTALATARLAIVAAALGDPIAADMDAQVAARPPHDTLADLERVIAAQYWARRVPKAAAVAAVTIDGRRTEMPIGAGDAVSFTVTPAQRAGLRIDPVSGSVLVVSRWDGPVAQGDLAPPRGQSITRTVAPAGTIGATDRVSVTFQVTLGPDADPGCWRVTDFAPSGLVPIAGGRWSPDEEDAAPGAIPPWSVVGQRVDFCVTPDRDHPVQTLGYLARVVTPGTYRWEPAVLQSSIVTEQGIVLPSFDVTIRGLGT